MPVIGFSGSRRGLTAAQQATLKQVLLQLCPKGIEAHHGLCQGADSQFHQLVENLYTPAQRSITGHPPVDRSHFQANTCDVILPPKPYLDRNKSIVQQADVLIACPGGPPTQRSGTWATVRHARSQGKKFVVIRPDGYVQ